MPQSILHDQFELSHRGSAISYHPSSSKRLLRDVIASLHNSNVDWWILHDERVEFRDQCNDPDGQWRYLCRNYQSLRRIYTLSDHTISLFSYTNFHCIHIWNLNAIKLDLLQSVSIQYFWKIKKAYLA